jgi:hypothetical protein
MTGAQATIARIQKAHPPRTDTDGARQLFDSLVPSLPKDIVDLFVNGTVAVGEVGRNTPDVRMRPIEGDRSYVIEFNSGMIEFIYAVVHTLAGLNVQRTTLGAANEPAQRYEDVIDQVADLYKDWKWPKKWLWLFRRTPYHDSRLTVPTLKWDERVARHAELFMLAHEIGHVVIDLKMLQSLNLSLEIKNVEQAADAIGLAIVLRYARSAGHSIELAYAGAVLAIRTFAGLQRVGVKFLSDYGDHLQRIENIRSVIRSQCSGDQDFHELSRVAVAYEDEMDDVENHIVTRSAPWLPTEERILVRLIAELLDVAIQRLPMGRFQSDLERTASNTPRDTMRRVIRTLFSYYSVANFGRETHIDPDTRRQMGARLLESVSDSPEQVKKLLEDALLEELRSQHRERPEDAAVGRQLARVLHNKRNDAKMENALAQRDALLDELCTLSRSFPDDSSVRDMQATALFNTLYDAKTENAPARRDELLDELRALHYGYPNDAAVREAFAKGLFKTGKDAKEENQPARSEALLKELRVLSHHYQSDDAIRQLLEKFSQDKG